MATISSHNPFRANPLSPNATGVSINPPPSFHSVAGDDETTINPLADIVPDLPSIAEERDLPSLPSSPIITLDPPPPPHIQEEDEEEPPAYSARPDVNHGESTLELGPRRPFQQPRVTARPSPAPGLSPSFTGPGLASTYYLSPTPTGTSFPRPRRQRQGLLNLLVDALAPPFEQLSTTTGIGNLTAPDNGQSSRSQGPRHTRSFSSFTPNSVGSTPASPPPPLPPRQNSSMSRLSPHPSTSSPTNPSRARSPSTGSNSTTATARTASTASVRSDFARDFYATGEAEGLLNLDSDPSSHRVPEQGNAGSPPPSSWSTPPGARARRRNSFDSNQFVTSSSLPPNQPSPNPNRAVPPETGLNSTTTTTRSDFARDFYAAGEADGLINLESEGPRNGGPRRPPTRRRSSFDDATPIATSSTAQSQPTRATVDDDNNRPTTKPAPGHPLLRDGKILVYPKGHTCSKCFNVGYKRADPRHPCKKCWKKYSKAYTPALLYAPDANAVTTLQRPLPRLIPPQSAPALPPPSTRPPAPSQTMRTPSGSGPGVRPQPNRLRSHRYSLSESSSPVSGSTSRPFGSPAPGSMATVVGGAPPDAIVYPAGDPRLGGSRCWRCGGGGTVSFFILDSSQCDQCGGIGRLYI